ncbi:MAG TPA: hypothetical protein VFQ70_00050 [Candidatus Saccharimonadaceae bacterium]|nr:hypothetical protein [Candidatus Saccharimonadaceae bacterium]
MEQEQGEQQVVTDDKSLFARAMSGGRVAKIGRVAIAKATSVRTFLQRDITLPRPRNPFSVDPRTPKEQVSDEITHLKHMVEHSHEVICDKSTVFPFTFFPDEIILDRTKVTIIKRNFFWSSDVLSFRIEDILNVSSSYGPFFGSVTITSRVMSTVDHYEIDHFWRSDAIHIKHMIQGFVIAKHSKIDLDELTVPEIVDTLNELGRDTSAEDDVV